MSSIEYILISHLTIWCCLRLRNYGIYQCCLSRTPTRSYAKLFFSFFFVISFFIYFFLIGEYEGECSFFFVSFFITFFFLFFFITSLLLYIHDLHYIMPITWAIYNFKYMYYSPILQLVTIILLLLCYFLAT